MADPHERLKQARKDAGYKTARQAAEALGITYSTYAGHENGSVSIPRDRALHYSQRFHITVDWLLTGKQSSHLQNAKSLSTLPLIGEVQAGAWKEAVMYDSSEQTQIETPQADIIPGATQYWLRIVGDSVNRVIPDGGHAQCVSVHDYARDTADLYRRAHNKLVVVERKRAGLHELTIKRLVVTDAGAQLHPVSTNPTHNGPITLAETGDDEVQIIAVVIRAIIEL